MTFWAPLSPETVFDGIYEVEPGQLIVAERGRVEKRHYWRWTLAPEGQGLNGGADRAEELRALLDDATRIRLRADVPVGAYLSGGLDSFGPHGPCRSQRRHQASNILHWIR